jgi:hypothetical protein
MTDRDGPRSNPYHPDPEKCCEACVFGSGEHARWCALYQCSMCGEFHGPPNDLACPRPWLHWKDWPLRPTRTDGDTSDVKHAS